MIKLLSGLKKNKQQAAILIAVLTVVAVIAYVNFLLRPQAERVIKVFRNAAKASSDLKGAKALIAKTDEMNKVIEEYNKKVGRYEKTLPTEHGLPTLLEDLSEMARASNMRIVGVVPVAGKESAVRPGQAYREIPITVNARSGYHELGRFLSRLEKCDRFIKVADIQIKANRTNPGRHDVELLVLTYVLLGGR